MISLNLPAEMIPPRTLNSSAKHMAFCKYWNKERSQIFNCRSIFNYISMFYETNPKVFTRAFQTCVEDVKPITKEKTSSNKVDNI